MSGGSNRAANEANRQERERQAAIKGTQTRVNQVFDSPQREGDITDFMSALRERSTGDLNRKKDEADLDLKFALARSGQTGGSNEVFQRRRFGEDYSRALLGVERGVQGAGAELRSADQDARARLIGLATQGLDATTGASQAAAAMRSNLQASSATNLVGGIDNAFGSWAKFFEESKDRAARRRADQQAFGLYGPMGYGGGGG